MKPAWGHGPSRALLLLALGALAPLPALAACSLGRLAELPVTMQGLKPIVHAGINGQDVRLIADTGAFYSVLTPAAAAQLNLRLTPAAFGVYLQGIGGDSQMWVTVVKSFNLLSVTFPDVVFVVGGNSLANGTAGVLGENLYHLHDVEYDLANGVIRLFRPHDCKNVNLAYWAKSTAQSVSQLDLEDTGSRNPLIVSSAYVNGVRLRVVFDTGAGESTLSLDAAKRAGIKPDSPGVTFMGNSHGVGRHPVRYWVVPIESFKVGGEEVKNTQLRMFESLLERVDMLLGADFFLSHRILVSNSERKLFFTYNGGPVFRLPESRTDSPQVYYGRGVAELREGRQAAGRADLAKATELDPKIAEKASGIGISP